MRPLEAIRLFLMVVMTLLTSIISLFWAALRPKNPKGTHFASRLFAFFAKPLLGFKLEIEGQEHLKRQSPAIFISNHQHNLDIVPMGMIIPPNTVSVGKKSILYIPFFGLLYWLTGNILIERSNRRKALKAMDQVAQKIKDQGVSIWIMPEGTRSLGRGVLPFKKGAFYSAVKAQVPIVPICINSYDKNLDLGRLHSGTIRIKVLPPIATTNLTTDDVEALTNSTYQLVKREVEQLDAIRNLRA